MGDLFFVYLHPLNKGRKMKKILLIILCSILFIGCTSTQYIPVEHTKVEYIHSLQIDTCLIKDSIYIKEKNDTVYLEKYKYLYKNKVIKDTVIINDTIPIIKTVEVTKEINVIKDWQTALMVMGGAFIVFLLLNIKRLFRV